MKIIKIILNIIIILLFIIILGLSIFIIIKYNIKVDYTALAVIVSINSIIIYNY